MTGGQVELAGAQTSMLNTRNDVAVAVPEPGSVPTLAQLLPAHRGERHAVVLHDFPDPDAISSAFAHRLISSNFGIETDILYNGRISHLQNLALVRLLGIDLVRFSPGLNL